MYIPSVKVPRLTAQEPHKLIAVKFQARADNDSACFQAEN